MTKKDLVKVIQEVVRREVKKEVKKIFIKEQTTSKDSAPVLADIVEQEISQPKKEVQYTKNKSLNDVLNETKSSPLITGCFAPFPMLTSSEFKLTVEVVKSIFLSFPKFVSIRTSSLPLINIPLDFINTFFPKIEFPLNVLPSNPFEVK